MATLAQIRTAFDEVFDSATLTAFTETVHNYDVVSLVGSQLGTNYEALMYHNGIINFAQYTISLAQSYSAATATTKTYIIDVTYAREVDLDGVEYNKIWDFFEALLPAVDATIGHTFNDLITGYAPQETTPLINLQELHEKQVWISTFTITAYA